MTERLTQLAEQTRVALAEGTAAFRSLVATLFGEEVNFLHVPPQPIDQMMTRQALLDHESRIDAGFGRAMPGFSYDNPTVSTDQGELRADYVLTGRLADGSELRVPLGHVYRFAGDRVVEYVVVVSAEDADRLRRVLAPN